MRILLANDDGIDAPGLALATEAALRLSDDVWVVAPSAKRTAAGNSLTVARPLTMQKRGERRWSCSGTPADCIVTAMTWLFRDGGQPDLVLSGVNDGKNVGEDIAYSGTLGVAREATFWGVPAIAMSRVKNADYRSEDAGYLADLIGRLWAARADWVVEGHWLSLNLPARLPAPLAQARIGRDKIARNCEIVSESADQTELIVPRGRSDSAREGDENSLLAQGYTTINRLAGFGEMRLDDGFLGGT